MSAPGGAETKASQNGTKGARPVGSWRGEVLGLRLSSAVVMYCAGWFGRVCVRPPPRGISSVRTHVTAKHFSVVGGLRVPRHYSKSPAVETHCDAAQAERQTTTQVKDSGGGLWVHYPGVVVSLLRKMGRTQLDQRSSSFDDGNSC